MEFKDNLKFKFERHANDEFKRKRTSEVKRELKQWNLNEIQKGTCTGNSIWTFPWAEIAPRFPWGSQGVPGGPRGFQRVPWGPRGVP